MGRSDMRSAAKSIFNDTKKAMTQEVAKVTGSCQLFFAFSICRCLWLATGNLVALFLKPTVLDYKCDVMT